MRIATAVRALATCLLIIAAWSALGCAKGGPRGELVGKYDIEGALLENTCGQGALPTPNPLIYTTELRATGATATWTLTKSSSFSGTLRDSGELHFQTDSTVDMGTTLISRDVQPGDFLNSGGGDPDIKRAHCILVIRENISGQIHRRWLDDDAGSSEVIQLDDADSGLDAADLEADDMMEIAPASGADCTAALAVGGGTYTTLPCSAHYSLEGTLEN